MAAYDKGNDFFLDPLKQVKEIYAGNILQGTLCENRYFQAPREDTMVGIGSAADRFLRWRPEALTQGTPPLRNASQSRPRP